MKITILIYITFLSINGTLAQTTCFDTLRNINNATRGKISWDSFPEFHLPPQFKIIYQGPRLHDSLRKPLKHGFTHIANNWDDFGVHDKDSLKPKNRAMIWAAIANLNGQPWKSPCYSPWNNDTNFAFKNFWKNSLSYLAGGYTDSKYDSIPKADIICLDIESRRVNNFNNTINYIDTLYYHPSACNIPTINLNNLSTFRQGYERDMMLLYNSPMNYIRKGLQSYNRNTILSSYADGPIATTWWKIQPYSWAQWQTNSSLIDYICKDVNGQFSNTAPFYNNQDFLAPAGYFYYNNNPKSLAYALFQIEANRAKSTKDIIFFEWLRTPSAGKFINHSEAEALAIFPILSGANGVWLWDYYEPVNYPLMITRADTMKLETYDYYIKGLYRLSKFSHYFNGNYTLYIPKNARDLFVNNEPVWRAVVNGNNILIAAQNPYANDTDTTLLPISYSTWTNTIKLIGKQVFLCDFTWTNVGIQEPNINPSHINIFPNPTQDYASISSSDKLMRVTIYSSEGQILYRNTPGTSFLKLTLADFIQGIYFIEVITEKGRIIEKLAVIR